MNATSNPRPKRPRGGRGGAEPRSRILERERRVWELSLRGEHQRAIAEQLQISQPAVCKIRQRLLDRHAATLAADAKRHQALQAARIEYIYALAMSGYTRSQADAVAKTQRRIQGSGPNSSPRDLHEIRTTTRAGDPRFLVSALDATQALAQIAPPPAAAPTEADDLTDLTPEEFDLLTKLMERKRMTGPPRSSGNDPEEGS